MSVEFDQKIHTTLADANLQLAIYTATGRLKDRRSVAPESLSTRLNVAPVRPPGPQPWQYAVPTEEQMRNPLNIIPPDQRPRVALRFADQNQLLVSGLLQGGGDIAQRPVVVDVPVEKGHVVLFANNPIWRGETIGSYGMVWNTIMNFDNLNAGRKWDAR